MIDAGLRGFRVALAAVLVAAAGGCASPLREDSPDEILRRRVLAAVDRELAALPVDETLHQTVLPPGEAERALAGRREELAAMGPQRNEPYERLDIGVDLTGRPQEEVTVNLPGAIGSSVRGNLSLQIARLQPAISETEVVAAEAAFDWVFGAGAEWNRVDEPTVIPVIAGNPIGTPTSGSDQFRFDAGVRKRLTTGGELFIETNLNRIENRTPGLTLLPDPSYDDAIRLGLTQPLLRGFGTSVNTSAIRLSRNLERRSIEQLRLDLLDLVAGTETAYWELVFTWQDLTIAQWLVDVGVQVRDVMDLRRDFDTRLAEYSDAVARVEQRRSDVIRARRAIRAASDALKVLMNDPRLSVGSEALIVPADWMVELPIRYELREAITTGVGNRPEIQQAILLIDDASIRQELADNQRLPLLNLAAEMSYFGLSDDAGGAYDETFDGSFMNWLLGLTFEQPIGNRAAEAGYRRARLERSQTVINYQRAVQDVVFDVKRALRNCVAAYELIQASRSSRIANAENLRALLVEEETLAGLTPEFLNLKFQRQERLAEAQREEIRALVIYNQSVATLYRSMGVGLEMNQIQFDVGEAGNAEAAIDAGDGAHAEGGPGN